MPDAPPPAGAGPLPGSRPPLRTGGSRPTGSGPRDDGPDELVVVTTAPATGGSSVARDPDGRVVLVDGALPGERVAVAVRERRRDLLRADVVTVLEPSPDRVVPACRHLAEGCGGCDFQHVDPMAQPAVKRAVVVEALRRVGGVTGVPVETGPVLPATGFRTTVRAAVHRGRAGFRAGRRHDVVPVDHCLVAHPLIDEVLAGGRFDRCDEVTVRVGAATGDRLVIASPDAGGAVLPGAVLRVGGEGGRGPDPAVDGETVTRLIGDDELDAGRRAWIHEAVAGRRFRISARSFFQTRPDGAAALVDEVRRAGGDELASASRVVDAYAGVGLFAATVAPAGAQVTAIESSPSSVADARHNLVSTAPPGSGRATVLRSRVERWRPRRADVVVADPSRKGLGREAAAVLAATRAGVLVLVSCDAASLGRDAGLLRDLGYRFERSVLVDLFPHTHHVEVVSRFVR